MNISEKIYRYSSFKLVLMFVGLLLISFLIFSLDHADYFLYAFAGTALIITVYYATINVKISEQEITTRNWLGSKTIGWNEIERVSMRGQSLRLHDRDDDVTLYVDSQVEGYAEILDILFAKRPSLFDFGEDETITRGWVGGIIVVGLGLLIMALSIPIFIYQQSEWFWGLLFVAFGIVIIIYWFLSPQKLEIQEKRLVIKYLYKEVVLMADQIDSFSLEKRSTKNGNIYFPRANIKTGKHINLPVFKQGSILTYQFLKRWHEKSIKNRSSYYSEPQ